MPSSAICSPNMNFLLHRKQSARGHKVYTYLLSVEAVGLVHSLCELSHVERAQRIRQEGDDALEEEVKKEDAAGAAEEAVEDNGQPPHLRLRRCAAVACRQISIILFKITPTKK